MLPYYSVNTFLDFLRKYNHWLVFLLFEALSLALLFSYNSYQGSVWFTAANTMAAKLNGIYADGLSFLQLRQVNQGLVRRNVELETENEKLRQTLAHAVQDTTAAAQVIYNELNGYDLIPALVVSNSKERARNFLVINRGTNDGVFPEMGVVSGSGVVGIVYLCGPHYSLVIPIVNRHSSISCRVRGQNYFGSLQWEGKDFRRAGLNDVPRYAQLKKGDIVETSGYSAVFPPGIFVGRVTSVSNSSDGQSYNLGVLLGTNFSNLRDVMVIKTHYKAEMDTLRSHAEQLSPSDLTGNAPANP